MRRNSVRLAAATMAAGALALSMASTAAAGEDRATTAANCRSGQVFLDGIRAIAVGEVDRDEVYLATSSGAKVWPASGPYVSMGKGQRVEVDKCIGVNTHLRLIEVDDFNPDDTIGGQTIGPTVPRDYEFCCGENSHYRLGVIA